MKENPSAVVTLMVEGREVETYKNFILVGRKLGDERGYREFAKSTTLTREDFNQKPEDDIRILTSEQPDYILGHLGLLSNELRESIEDFIKDNGREEKGQMNILITGGTGSFGQKFTEVILREYNPKSVWIYSRGELLQLEMERKFNDPRLRFIIGDIRDKERLNRAVELAKPDLIVHAAALKMIPPIEYNPIESVKTNILGAQNLIEVALDHSVDKVFAISTDKACHPCNLYGACKMAMEKLFVEANRYGKTKFSCSRYGNVVDARGEILEIWREQARAKVLDHSTLTITDERMTRFWLTIEEGVEFVINCIDKMVGGEIFIPKKLPSVRMVDLAKAIAPDCYFELIGIRPGEKLHESLISMDEARHSLELDNCYIIEPELDFWKPIGGNTLPDNFTYASGTNDWFLNVEELRKYVEMA